jgi:hypothetical protein
MASAAAASSGSAMNAAAAASGAAAASPFKVAILATSTHDQETKPYTLYVLNRGKMHRAEKPEGRRGGFVCATI